MNFPPMIDIKPFYIGKKFDKISLINYAYIIFKKDFIETQNNELYFQKTRVFVKSEPLDCSNCDNNCNNDFECFTCPWRNKEDIFQHLTSNEDPELKLKNPQNYRTPGVFCKERTVRITWLRAIIENFHKSPDIQWVIKPYKKNLDTIKLYHKTLDVLIIMRLKTFENGNRVIYLITAYNNPAFTYIKEFK